jgi:hypothetical protein
MAAGYLEEPDGTKSSTRLMAFISLIASIGFGIVAITKPAAEASVPLNLVMSFLTSSVVGKSAGKAFEQINKEP